MKIPRAGILIDRQDVERFLREARSAAQLHHPHIVPVHEAGRAEDAYYIASELIEGATLRERLEQGWRPTQRETAALIAKTASALHYAHNRGVVHRDIKPENLMVDASGEPLVMDFGLARRAEPDLLQTQEGVRMGTLPYMSPEQARGESHLADARSDLWSLGVILYELLTGRRPFAGDAAELLRAIQEKEPESLRKLDRTIPKDLETICLRCLVKEVQRRYPSCQYLADELLRWIREEPVHARPIGFIERGLRWGRRNPVVASLSAAAAALLVAVAAVSMEGYRRTSAALGVADHERDVAQMRNREADLARQKERAARSTAEAEAAEARRQEEIAQRLRREADDAREQEAKARDVAEQRDREARQQLARFLVARGRSLLDADDPFGAAVWFVEAMKWTPADAREDTVHFRRAASVLRHSPLLHAMYLHEFPVAAMAFSHDSELLATGSFSLYVWDVRRGKSLQRLEVVPLPLGPALSPIEMSAVQVRRLAFSPGRKHLLAVADYHEFPVAPPKLTPKSLLDFGSAETLKSVVRVWDTANWQPKFPPVQIDAHVDRAAFGPEDRWVVLGAREVNPAKDSSKLTTAEGAVRVVDSETGSLLHVTPSHIGVLATAMSAKESRYTTKIERGCMVRVWDTTTDAPVSPFLRHGARVAQVVFSPDDTLVATADEDGVVRLWDLKHPRRFSKSDVIACQVSLMANPTQFSPDAWHRCDVEVEPKLIRVTHTKSRRLTVVTNLDGGQIHNVSVQRR